MMAPNGTSFGGWLLNTADNHFGPPGDFDGDGHAETLVVSPWGIGMLKLSGRDDGRAHDGAERHALRRLAAEHGATTRSVRPATSTATTRPRSSWRAPGASACSKRAGATMAAPMMAPNGTRFGGWLLNTADNSFGPVGDFDGDGHAEILVTSPWGIGVFKLTGARSAR